jgi:hypothetical protein
MPFVDSDSLDRIQARAMHGVATSDDAEWLLGALRYANDEVDRLTDEADLWRRTAEVFRVELDNLTALLGERDSLEQLRSMIHYEAKP